MNVSYEVIESLSLNNSGYIAGSGDGILTIAGKPASRTILLFDAQTMVVTQRVLSLPNGHFMFFGLIPNNEYLVIARDFKKEFEPFAWDYVTPANDLTINEQQALWQSWQNN